MIEHDCKQYSEQWTRLRLGKPTASGFHHIITPGGKPTESKERRKYMFRLVAERLLGQAMDDSHETIWMKRGSKLEDDAVAAFMVRVRVNGYRKAGFFTALDGRVGASPDLILGHGGEGVEIKCPAPYTQVEYLIDGPGDKYRPQVQGQLFVCEWNVMHFWAWHPLMPSVHIVTKRDDIFIHKLAPALNDFCREVDDAEAFARGKGSFRLAEKLRLSEEMSVGEILDNL